ncbi:hypothetical protein [Sphingomonas sp. NFR04]|uniref:hypothetical protein n=1 Tax=Sphingomonas sp. NFR04 TaxID=1566283 RepID=UPI000B84FBA9|nr:hypothetical protein [Sphingomonas sp. NFR04]
MMHSPQLRFEGPSDHHAEAVGLASEGAAQDRNRCGFTPLEWLCIAIGQQEGIEARGGLFRLGALLRRLFGGPRVRHMAVDRLEVLSRVAARAQIGGARLADEDITLFRRAGYSNGQLLLMLASLEQAQRPPRTELS